MNTVAVTADSKTVEMIEVALIQVSPDNPRKTFDQKALEELAASIASEGIHVPLLVRVFEGEKRYELIAGERRLRASKIAGNPRFRAYAASTQTRKPALHASSRICYAKTSSRLKRRKLISRCLPPQEQRIDRSRPSTSHRSWAKRKAMSLDYVADHITALMFRGCLCGLWG